MPLSPDHLRPRRLQTVQARAFTIIEMMAAAAISIVLIGTLLTMVNHITKIWVQASSNIESFGAATATFNTMTRKLSQAVLNTYWSYDNPQRPTKYVRASELHFVVGKTSQLLGLPEVQYPGSAIFFQAPLGRTLDGKTSKLTSRLNATGFFTVFGDTPSVPSVVQSVVPARPRFRLYEWMEPTGDLSVYSAPTGMDWFKADASQGSASDNLSVMGSNLIGFFILAEYPQPNGTWKRSYSYNSRDAANEDTLNQLPPRLRIVLAAIDDASASRLAAKYGSAAPPVAPPSGKFVNPDEFESDLENWKTALQGQVPKVNWRIFSTTIQIPNSRWSVQ